MKLLTIILGIFFITVAKSSTIVCPSIEEIKQGTFIGWLPLYIEGEELASQQDAAKFIQNVTEFNVARWSTTYLEYAHCFYNGEDPIIDRIVLAQDAWQPLANSPWLWIIPNKLAECRSPNPPDCIFIS